MKKWTYIIATVLSGSVQLTHAGTMGATPDCWSGFYAGVSGAYMQSAKNNFQTTVSDVSWNQGFFPNSFVVSGTLSNAGSHLFSIKEKGASWGGLLGYQVVKENSMLWGAEAELQFPAGVATTETYASQQSFGVAALNYQSSVEETKDVDYLASLRGRMGYLVHPKFLLYATAGFAFGKVKLTTDTLIENTGAPAFFPANSSQGRSVQTKGGWTAGAGAEWNFMNNLSARLEYKYYDLGTVSTLSSFNYMVSLPALTNYAFANVNSRVRFAYNTIELGLNYHFC